MSDAAALRDNVHRLARVHAATIQTDDGAVMVKADPLVHQLRQAISPSGSGGNGGSPTKQRLPMNADAFDAYQLVREQAVRALQSAGTLRTPRTLEGIILRYQAEVLKYGADALRDAADLTGEWVRYIGSILTPVKPRRPTQEPCPACDQLWDTSDVERRWAVTVWAGSEIPMAQWEAYCSACGAEWVGEDIKFYLAAQDALCGRVNNNVGQGAA